MNFTLQIVIFSWQNLRGHFGILAQYKSNYETIRKGKNSQITKRYSNLSAAQFNNSFNYVQINFFFYYAFAVFFSYSFAEVPATEEGRGEARQRECLRWSVPLQFSSLR